MKKFVACFLKTNATAATTTSMRNDCLLIVAVKNSDAPAIATIATAQINTRKIRSNNFISFSFKRVNNLIILYQI